MKSIFLLLGMFFLTFFVQGQITVRDYIKRKIENPVNNNEIYVNNKKIFTTKVLTEFYKENNFDPAWKNTKDVNEAIEIIKSSYDEGLVPEYYHLNKILTLNETSKNDKNAKRLADLDILITDAIFKYASDLLIGKVDQSEIIKGWDIPKNKLPKDGAERLISALNSNNLKSGIDALKPETFMYINLKKGLKRYRDIAENGGWPKVKIDKVLKPQMKDTTVITLRKYLTLTGDLPPNTFVEDITVYDNDVVKAIKTFQFRHNIKQDGILGKNTLSKINIPVDAYIDKIRVNLERSRWIMHKLEDDFVVVNIAGFNVRHVVNDSVIFFSKVIVGKKNHETPIFKGKIKYIIINPTWTVPYSIATKEMLPKLKKNASYLSKHNLVILNKQGKEVDPLTIDFKKLSPGNFPYIIKQNPGPTNALGRIKFIFPNNYSVYLHDTPSHDLFSRTKRDFSHGCIRVDDKWGLFHSIVNDTSWTQKRVEEVLNSGKTTRIDLKIPIDILILYWTAGADKKQRLFFNNDVYNRDDDVLKELDKI
jgi:murein L,D-transpeptidase YcbB/YkuD